MSALERCPSCGADKVRTLDTRPHPLGRHRRKGCDGCGHRWATIEMPATLAQASAKARTELEAAIIRLTRAAEALEGSGSVKH